MISKRIRFSGFCLTFFLLLPAFASEPVDVSKLTSPILLRGDRHTAYRDPAVLYHDGVFHLFCTKVEVEPDRAVFSYTVRTESTDLRTWSEPVKLTPRDRNLNYSSPGNVVRFGDRWVLCLQTYPRPGQTWSPDGPPTFANAEARLFTMTSSDLRNWSEPELLRVFGPDVSREDMGRMIDPYLIEDRNVPGRWWCFFKHRGRIGFSHSTDLVRWEYQGDAASGENPCIIPHGNGYRLYYSPENGIRCKTSKDLIRWKDEGEPIVLGQDRWPWAQGRLTAGFVLDLKNEPRIGKYLMFFHGSRGPKRGETQMNFDIDSHIGLAWSDDLETWHWPPD